MIERPTWWRWVAGLMAALLIAVMGAAPTAGAPACAEESAAVAATADGGVNSASEAPADDLCPDGCLACAHCQSHSAAAGITASAVALAEPFATPERHDPGASAPLRSYAAHRLKRPPRA